MSPIPCPILAALAATEEVRTKGWLSSDLNAKAAISEQRIPGRILPIVSSVT